MTGRANVCLQFHRDITSAHSSSGTVLAPSQTSSSSSPLLILLVSRNSSFAIRTPNVPLALVRLTESLFSLVLSLRISLSEILNQASLEPFPSIEDVFHQVAWNHPGSFYSMSLFFPFLCLHVFSDPTTSALSFSRTYRPLELERKTIRGILRRTVRSSPPSQAILGSSPDVTVEMSQATWS